MSPTYEQLRAMSDEQIVQDHDKLAVHTVVGTRYYLDEIARREFHRASQAALAEARAATRLAKANTVVAIVAAVVAVAAIVVPIFIPSCAG